MLLGYPELVYTVEHSTRKTNALEMSQKQDSSPKNLTTVVKIPKEENHNWSGQDGTISLSVNQKWKNKCNSVHILLKKKVQILRFSDFSYKNQLQGQKFLLKH